jgi:hypothetical protein
MRWRLEDLVTGERLQALAEVTVLTHSILGFHRSLPQSGVRDAVLFPGTHTTLHPDPVSIDALRGRRSIFVYSHLLPSFLSEVLPRLDHRFVLITHNSDDRVDARFQETLDDSRIVHWYAQNAMVRHPKLTPLPIGIANAQWRHGALSDLIAVAAGAPSIRRNVAYCNFDVNTNATIRAPLKEKLARADGMWQAPAKPFRDYLTDMAQCRWCVSPPGNGIDCHRTWEALYLGVVPVVQRSVWGSALHDGLPVIQMEDLGRLDSATLAAEQGIVEARELFDERRLTMGYWRTRVAESIAEIR